MTANASFDLANATSDEIAAFVNSAEAADVSKAALIELMMSKISCNETGVVTDGDIQNLMDLATAADIAKGAILEAKAAQGQKNASGVARSAGAENAINNSIYGTLEGEVKAELYKPREYNFTGGAAANKARSGRSGGSGKSKEATEFDTAAESIKNLRAQLDSLNTILENTDPYSQKLDTLKLIIAKQQEYNDALKSQADVYQAEYQKSLTALPQQWQDNITGDKNFSIDEVPASLKDAVNRAQDFKDKWTSVNQSILQANRELEDTKQKVYELV